MDKVKKNKKPNILPSKLGRIPVEWKKYCFEDISEIDSESLDSNVAPDYLFRYISLSDVDKGTINSILPQFSFKGSPSRAKRIIKKGDILLATVRPNLQAFAIVKGDVKDHIASTGFAVVRPRKGFLAEYIYQYLFTNHFTKQVSELITGSNYPAINSSDVCKLTIFVPRNFPEQQKISRILSTWDKAIEKTEQLIEQKQQLKKGLMQQLLTGKVRFKEFVKSKKMKKTKLGLVPEDWTFSKLGDLVFIKDGTHVTPKYLISGIPFLRVTDLVNNQENTNKKYISLEEHRLLTRVNKPTKGDILYSKNGTIGVAKLIDWEWEFSIFVSLALLRIKDPKNVYDNFLELWLNSDLAKHEIYRGVKQGTVTNLHLEEIEQFRIVIPSKKEQIQIASTLHEVNMEIRNSNNKLSQLKLQKKGLMQRLLTGEVRVKI